MPKSGEIEHCGIEIDMFDLEKAPEFICRFLMSRGAPKGSKLEYRIGEKEIVLPFGAAEGLAIYTNGAEFPKVCTRVPTSTLLSRSSANWLRRMRTAAA